MYNEIHPIWVVNVYSFMSFDKGLWPNDCRQIKMQNIPSLLRVLHGDCMTFFPPFLKPYSNLKEGYRKARVGTERLATRLLCGLGTAG